MGCCRRVVRAYPAGADVAMSARQSSVQLCARACTFMSRVTETIKIASDLCLYVCMSSDVYTHTHMYASCRAQGPVHSRIPVSKSEKERQSADSLRRCVILLLIYVCMCVCLLMYTHTHTCMRRVAHRGLCILVFLFQSLKRSANQLIH